MLGYDLQEEWNHRVLKIAKSTDPKVSWTGADRLNLSFRHHLSDEQLELFSLQWDKQKTAASKRALAEAVHDIVIKHILERQNRKETEGWKNVSQLMIRMRKFKLEN